MLITGESGTGKELVARALHEGSSRRNQPAHSSINCAAIPKDLMESELFGYERGAFTGAVTSKPGRFELADGGTLFLDEIGEIPVEMQVKLLRALQESEFERVGGIKTIAGRRPPGRRHQPRPRRGDRQRGASARTSSTGWPWCPSCCHRCATAARTFPPWSGTFSRSTTAASTSRLMASSRTPWRVLQAYAWPGNIRELENLIERVLLFADGPLIHLKDLPEALRGAALNTPSSTLGSTPSSETGLKDIVRMRAAELEKDLITRALEETGGNVTRAAKLLQISRKSLQTKMKEFGLRGGEAEE